MRTIRELLIILRDNPQWFEKGLCIQSRVLYVIANLITFEEYYIIKKYIKDNRPSFKSPLCRKAVRFDNRSDSAYYWKYNSWEPRLRWLNYHIKKLK